MRRPSCVCNASMAIKDFVHVRLGLCNKFLEFGDFTNLFEGEHLILSIAIDCKARRVIAAIL